MKRRIVALVLACTMGLGMVACGSSSSDATKEGTTSIEEGSGVSELVDGKFAETKHITVEVYDRGNDGGTDPTDNMYTEYIKKGMLEDHNVEVEFVAVPRWTETEEINNLLASGGAPDICLTYSYPTIQTYANMGGVLDMKPMLDQYGSELTNLQDWLGDTNIYWDLSDEDGTLWAIEGKRANNRRINTFMRKDWLDKLGLEEPTTQAEFYDCICAFRDNAKELLGKDADKMVPFSVSFDVGWRAALLIESQMDPKITDKEFYINGFDDRKLTQKGTKEAMKTLNKWYNEGLLWKDFALYTAGDSTEDDMMKAGYVGAFQHNWDYPFRSGEDSIQANLKRIVGDDAKYVAVDCFENSEGKHLKYVDSTAGDRKIFFPSTNDEPLASLLYLDWISAPEHIKYLQIGDEGVTHNVLEDGAIECIAATGDPIMNSGNNIDYTITCNGLNLGDEDLTLLSMAHSYPCCDPEDVQRALDIAATDNKIAKNVKVPEIVAENGMGEALGSKRDVVYDTALAAKEADFDKVWDSAIEDYLASGGQAIMDERTEKFEAKYGSATSID
ncbi:extracellular solute-binding protein [Pseudobutyrivibrio xylanivorans]|uniref:Putative aldouronate transport system substrate-binding protein n=1 Tax=Pseudobutyrivibrio xylanivorans TaxID=185007 RepID=A0A1G5RUA8_PSEXY|nr:extracellular solute-binding protein [Pseudobutyrivibrio xylanivorans]SCZ76909.1 putative aldouronate transport system substrate-binding protein [Pseudobutyrivibrio xylanivorans]